MDKATQLERLQEFVLALVKGEVTRAYSDSDPEHQMVGIFFTDNQGDKRFIDIRVPKNTLDVSPVYWVHEPTGDLCDTRDQAIDPETGEYRE